MGAMIDIFPRTPGSIIKFFPVNWPMALMTSVISAFGKVGLDKIRVVFVGHVFDLCVRQVRVHPGDFVGADPLEYCEELPPPSARATESALPLAAAIDARKGSTTRVIL
jgi:hypothetical protein